MSSPTDPSNKQPVEQPVELVKPSTKPPAEQSPELPAEPPNKLCRSCDNVKPLTEFPIKGGKHYHKCRDCKNEYERVRIANDREKYNSKTREAYRRKAELIKDKELTVDPNALKRCTGCGKDKPLSEFYVHKQKGTIRAECKECASEARKKLYQKKRDFIIHQTGQYTANRMKRDPVFKLERRLRNRVYQALLAQGQAKTKHLHEYLECTPAFFQEWIQFQFYDGMTMENYGPFWHIDHVKPCSAFDLSKQDQVRECFHWSNCRPYREGKNLQKSDKVDIREIVLQQLKATVFLKQYSSLNQDQKSSLPVILGTVTGSTVEAPNLTSGMPAASQSSMMLMSKILILILILMSILISMKDWRDLLKCRETPHPASQDLTVKRISQCKQPQLLRFRGNSKHQ